jgi:phosphoglycolate phosphatase-like HAD superfamily hydrolase
MDPLINHNIPVVAVSRGYYLGGRTTFGLTHRPDSKPLDEQLRAAVPKGSEVNLVEDDVFTGGSIRQMAQRYEDHGKIRRVVPGIQVGSPSHLENSGIAVLPVVRYQTVDGTDPVQEGRIELDDPRDFLVGSSGLVVQLPSGKNGRAPYVLPFVSPAERASVDPSMEEEFSQSVLAASRRFFQELEARCGRRIELGDVEPAFVDTMRELLGLDTHMPMVDVIDFCFMHMRELRERMFRMGEAMADRDRLMAELNELAIPKDVVFLDVNGTLFPDESQDGALDQSALAEFVDAARALRERDVRLGLCSDSPLAPLQAIAERLGIDGPIIAENGNVVFDGQREVAVQSLPDIPRLRERIQDVANAGGYLQVPDALSPEFGGGRVNGDGKEWAFGAGRSTSVSVFGDAALVQALHEHFKDEQGLSIDSSPEYGYFALHPGNLRANKGGTLRLLREQGRNVVMVGNSMSDWVPPESGVRCAFVGAARISAAAAQQAHYRAERPDLGGVVDILRYITNDYSKPNGQSHH